MWKVGNGKCGDGESEESGQWGVENCSSAPLSELYTPPPSPWAIYVLGIQALGIIALAGCAGCGSRFPLSLYRPLFDPG